MKRNQIVSCTTLLLCLLPSFMSLLAQRRDRLSGSIGGGGFAAVSGSRDPRVDTFADEGALALSEPVPGLGFRFQPSAEQAAKLERLLEDQRNPSSPRYHAWLTPDEYADEFGLSRNDFARVSQWLESQGFRVESSARSRTFICFSGTAGQVRDSFKTELHRLRANGKTHFANLAEAQVPASLQPLISSFDGLNDLSLVPPPRLRPHFAFDDGTHGLAPADLAAIYNTAPLLAKGYNGTGQKIAVVGASAIRLSDVQQFRDSFGLPPNDPQLILAPGVSDPGRTGFYEQALSDVEIAGSAAPMAAILYVYASNPFRGVQYAIDQNLAPVLVYTYDTCEKIWPKADLDAARALAQQANAQGITWIAPSGAAGAAGCEISIRDSAGITGPWVSVPAAFPEVTGVGGTSLADKPEDWTSDGATAGSARSYIAERAWNATPLGQGLAASGGGVSLFIPMPAWQKLPGVPRIDGRLVPDLAFAAAWDHAPYLIVANGELWAWGASSSTPFFAGVVAILNQYLVDTGAQAAPGLGNINPRLYELARTAPGVFHDITEGDNIVPCKPSTPYCLLERYGYSAKPGYDPVTGLGSLDVEKFVLNWSAVAGAGTTSTFLSFAASPATVDTAASTTLTAIVKGTAGGVAPSGTVTFRTGTRTLGDAVLSASGDSATATLKVIAEQLSAGTNTITAQYAGAPGFSPSTATAKVSVTGAAALIEATSDQEVVYKQTPDPDGFGWHYRIRLADLGGVASVVTDLKIDGTDFSDRIPTMFGSSKLPAFGSLTASLRAKITNTPVEHTYSFGGIDAKGYIWNREVTIRFLAEQGTAALSLTSTPSTLRLSPNGDPHCSADHPLYHHLNIEERNGIAVKLNRFVADGKDVSAQIESFFGSTRLPGFGVLRASLCWNSAAFPVTRSFEMGGIDANGQTVRATAQVTLTDGSPNPGTLSISKKSVELSAASGTVETVLNVNLPASEMWSVSVSPANQRTRWLTVTPTSGKGPAQIKLIGNATGLANGAYSTTLLFQSDKTVPQVINVPVVFAVGN